MLLKEWPRSLFTKITLLFKGVLQKGLTPQKLSLTLCLGTATGVMPLLWGTTILSALLAGFFKLNQAAMQALNFSNIELSACRIMATGYRFHVNLVTDPVIIKQLNVGTLRYTTIQCAGQAGVGIH